jgi:hypothetical protein
MQHIGQGLGNNGLATEKAVVKSYFRIHVHSFRYRVWPWAPEIDDAPSVTTLVSSNLAVSCCEDVDQ